MMRSLFSSAIALLLASLLPALPAAATGPMLAKPDTSALSDVTTIGHRHRHRHGHHHRHVHYHRYVQPYYGYAYRYYAVPHYAYRPIYYSAWSYPYSGVYAEPRPAHYGWGYRRW